MELVSLTPEGRIVLTLKHGKHTYTELRQESGLSDRWLTIKLEELEREGVVEKTGRLYGLRREPQALSYELSLFMLGQAKRMADELDELRDIRAIILFGSVAQTKADEYSDLDLVIVVGTEGTNDDVLAEIPKLESVYHMTVEPLILSEADFLENIRSLEGGIVYGMAEGYKILIDKTGELGKVLQERTEEIRHTYDYLEEERIWVKAK